MIQIYFSLGFSSGSGCNFLIVLLKNGQLSGLWENQFPLETGDYYSSDDEQSSDDEIESENFEMPKTTGVTTRSGRNATAFRL